MSKFNTTEYDVEVFGLKLCLWVQTIVVEPTYELVNEIRLYGFCEIHELELIVYYLDEQIINRVGKAPWRQDCLVILFTPFKAGEHDVIKQKFNAVFSFLNADIVLASDDPVLWGGVY